MIWDEILWQDGTIVSEERDILTSGYLWFHYFILILHEPVNDVIRIVLYLFMYKGIREYFIMFILQNIFKLADIMRKTNDSSLRGEEL
jgi:hypothetical protein